MTECRESKITTISQWITRFQVILQAANGNNGVIHTRWTESLQICRVRRKTAAIYWPVRLEPFALERMSNDLRYKIFVRIDLSVQRGAVKKCQWEFREGRPVWEGTSVYTTRNLKCFRAVWSQSRLETLLPTVLRFSRYDWNPISNWFR